MDLKKRKRKAFVKSFFITAAIIVPLCAATFFLFVDNKASEPVEQPAAEVPLAAASRSMLLLVYDEQTPLSAAAIRFDTADKAVYFAVVPTQSLSVICGGQDLSPAELARAVSAETADGFYGFYSVSLFGLQRAVDGVGTFVYSVPSDMFVYETNGLLVYEMTSGATRTDGLTAAQLVKYSKSISDEYFDSVCSGLLAAALDEYTDGGETRWLFDAYAAAYEFSATDINSQEIMRITDAAKAALAGGRVVETDFDFFS